MHGSISPVMPKWTSLKAPTANKLPVHSAGPPPCRPARQPFTSAEGHTADICKSDVCVFKEALCTFC